VHDGSQIPALLRSHFDANADLTIGTRFAHDLWASSVPGSKIAANFFATALINNVLSCELSDVASGMRIFSRRALALQFTACDYAIAYEFIAAALRKGLAIHEHPITVRYDAEELFCTGRDEFLNLLSFAIRNSGENQKLFDCVSQLQTMVLDYCKIHLKVKDKRLLLHPIKEYNAYAFQFQHAWYFDLPENVSWLTLV
jgi:hypothetical protein